MKMDNLGRFDETLAQKGISGLKNGSKSEKLFTLDDDCRIVLSSALRDATPREVYLKYFLQYDGKQIALPPKGRYRLEVRTRGGLGLEYKVVTASRDVEVGC